MVIDKIFIEKDWQNSKTRNQSADFFKWHKEWGVTLLQITPSITQDLKRKLEYDNPSFYIKSSEIGLWREKYVLQFGNFGIDEKDGIKINRLWLSDSNTSLYRSCEKFLQELLLSDSLWEITFEDEEGVDFVKWDHTYLKPKIKQF